MAEQSTVNLLHRASNLTGLRNNVHIVSDDGQVDPYDVTISKSTADQIIWFAYGAAGATIEFSSPDGSPFNESIFHVPAGGSVASGPATSAAVVNKYYKYTVKGRAGQNDPGVIIHN